MKLKNLIQNVPGVVVKGSKEVTITGMTAHSRQVAPGHLFVAKRGRNTDGSRFIPDAVASGAAAILTDMYDPFLPGVSQIIHPDVASLEHIFAARFFALKKENLFRIGITGTNGKTTTSYLVRHLFEDCGLIGTVEWLIGDRCFPSLQTTPDVITNHRLLSEMQLAGCKAAVMEVSSHGLDQGRVAGIDFDVAIFTNITRDHLDYHKTWEGYVNAKALLFTSLGKDKTAVVNADDPSKEALLRCCRAHVLSYGLQEGAILQAKHVVLESTGTSFDIFYGGKNYSCRLPLIGKHNVYNALAALGAGLARGCPLEIMIERLLTFGGASGRLEKVENTRGIHVFVDYAHTEDALLHVLTSLRECTKNRIITVFGCGGDRDRGKRAAMGAASTTLSDMTFITSDNPRTEDPQKIIEDIVEGAKGPFQIEGDRREAIAKAIAFAEPGDIVLIAGKGHETQQIYAHSVIAFDDRLVAKELGAK